MRPYAERRAARIARLQARAVARDADAKAAFGRADRIASVIPLGQPVLVGHHSERRHRRDLQRIDNGMRKGFEASKEAAELRRRATAAEDNDAISSDDPEAVDKLKARLEDLERTRAQYKEINVTIRTAQRHATRNGVAWEPFAVGGLVDMGISEAAARDLVQPDFAGRVGVAGYQFTNLGGNIRRVAQRITELEARAARTAQPAEVYGPITVDEADNRVRIRFPGKPAAEVRHILKSNGFRWAPTDGVWQRMSSNGAWYWAREIARKANGTIHQGNT